MNVPNPGQYPEWLKTFERTAQIPKPVTTELLDTMFLCSLATYIYTALFKEQIHKTIKSLGCFSFLFSSLWLSLSN